MATDFSGLIHKLEPMKGYTRPWFVCGGWAIDLHLGRQTRPHHDIDLGLFREDLLSLKPTFSGNTIYFFDNGEKHIWRGEYLELPIHELRMEGNGLELEFVLNEKQGHEWQYRRNKTITLPTEKLVLFSKQGIPYLAPEVVLLYKSQNIASKDQADFNKVLPKVSTNQQKWLFDAIKIMEPVHPWLL